MIITTITKTQMKCNRDLAEEKNDIPEIRKRLKKKAIFELGLKYRNDFNRLEVVGKDSVSLYVNWTVIILPTF